MRKLLLLIVIIISANASAQKVENIYFNLYTDSLKKGFYNYINVDGKCADGSWIPLDTKQIRLTATGGRFQGNDIFIDSSYSCDSIAVKAVLINNPSIWKETVIYIRKRGFDEPLKTNQEMLDEMQKKEKRKRN